MSKVNDWQKVWGESTGVEVEEANSGVTIQYSGVTLGKGKDVPDAILDAFQNNPKNARKFQTQLFTLGALGKDPEDLVDAFLDLFTEDEDEEDEGDEEDDDDIVVDD